MTRTSDTRITGYDPLLSPSALLDQLPLGDEAAVTVRGFSKYTRITISRSA